MGIAIPKLKFNIINNIYQYIYLFINVLLYRIVFN